MPVAMWMPALYVGVPSDGGTVIVLCDEGSNGRVESLKLGIVKIAFFCVSNPRYQRVKGELGQEGREYTPGMVRTGRGVPGFWLVLVVEESAAMPLMVGITRCGPFTEPLRRLH